MREGGLFNSITRSVKHIIPDASILRRRKQPQASQETMHQDQKIWLTRYSNMKSDGSSYLPIISNLVINSLTILPIQ